MLKQCDYPAFSAKLASKPGLVAVVVVGGGRDWGSMVVEEVKRATATLLK